MAERVDDAFVRANPIGDGEIVPRLCENVSHSSSKFRRQNARPSSRWSSEIMPPPLTRKYSTPIAHMAGYSTTHFVPEIAVVFAVIVGRERHQQKHRQRHRPREQAQCKTRRRDELREHGAVSPEPARPVALAVVHRRDPLHAVDRPAGALEIAQAHAHAVRHQCHADRETAAAPRPKARARDRRCPARARSAASLSWNYSAASVACRS